MTKIWNIFKRWKKRSLFHPSDDNIVNILGGGDSVSENSALKFSTVYTCVRVLSESLAQLPVKMYTRKNGGKVEAINHPLYYLLHSAPNPYTTAFNFWESMMASLALWGNGYALIDIDSAGKIAALWFLNPANVTPRQLSNGNVVYDVWSQRTGMKTYLWDEIFHVPGLGFDGIKGYSMVRLGADAIGQGMAASEYAGRFFKNDATPRGALQTDKKLTPVDADNLKKEWKSLYQGVDNAHKVAVLENGLKFQQMTINPEDAQLLETRKFQRSEIAGMFRVPPHFIGDLEHATFSNIEHQSIELIKFTLGQWMKRLEQSISLQLLMPNERKRYFAEWDANAFERGDITSRYAAYQVGIQSGVLSINEVRSKENLTPFEGGDEHYLQMQYQPISMAGKEVEDENKEGNTSVDDGVQDQ